MTAAELQQYISIIFQACQAIGTVYTQTDYLRGCVGGFVWNVNAHPWSNIFLHRLFNWTATAFRPWVGNYFALFCVDLLSYPCLNPMLNSGKITIILLERNINIHKDLKQDRNVQGEWQ